MTPADHAPSTLQALSSHERKRLRLLAQRYHIRSDGTLRPLADVTYDLRSRHGLDLTVRQVFDLLYQRDGSQVAPAVDVSVGLERLAHLASVVLNTHTNDHGRCNDCGLIWPCERVLLADHNLAVL